jgi:hypothetical protein
VCLLDLVADLARTITLFSMRPETLGPCQLATGFQNVAHYLFARNFEEMLLDALFTGWTLE